MALTDATIVCEVYRAFRAIAEGRASLASAGEALLRTLLEERIADAVRAHDDVPADDDEGDCYPEFPRLMPATDTGD